MDIGEGLETGSAFSLLSTTASSAHSLVLEAHTVVSSALSESPVIQQSSSEEIDVLSIDAGN